MSRRPLDAQLDASLTDEQLRRLDILEHYDLSPVRSRLLKDGLMPSSWVDEAIWEFRRYLAVTLIVPEYVGMFSKPVDDVWHTCLLFSRLYADLCQQVLGEFLHHEPSAEAEPTSRHGQREFEEAYGAMFGPPGRLWRMGESGH